MHKQPYPEKNCTFKVTWFAPKPKHNDEILFDILTLGFMPSQMKAEKKYDFSFLLPVILDRSLGLLTGGDL